MTGGLAALQARMQQDILHRDGSALDAIAVPPGHRAEDRLFVYQNAYVARLVEIMGKDYDTTWTYLGDQLFYDLARQFIAAHPSKTPNARWFSHGFPDFLAGLDLATQNPAVAEICAPAADLIVPRAAAAAYITKSVANRPLTMSLQTTQTKGG